jgi:hypothetical protein
MRKTARNFVNIVITAALAITFFSCREEEDARVKVEKLQFAVRTKTMAIGESATVGMTVSPKEARAHSEVAYTASVKGIVEIDAAKSSNDGVVIKAIKTGSAVVIARADGITEYCDITVNGNGEDDIPYIALTDSVLEIPLGHKRHIVASLQAGAPSDNLNFMFSGGNDKIAAVDFANNTAVIEGVGQGSTHITVSHPKAQYPVDVVVFVTFEGETAQYITSSENVVFMELGQGAREYSVKLIGTSEEKVNYCIYQVIEGQDKISVKGSGGSCSIEAKKEGMAKVRVHNQSVENDFEFLVIVKKTENVRYITSESNFYNIGGSTVNVNVYMHGYVSEDFIDYYTYETDNQGIIEVTQFKNAFFVKGLSDGNSRLTVNNRYSDYSCEILFAVQIGNTSQEIRDVFIRTSQQVIQMEAGGPDAILKMELVGGIEPDKNNFEWVVEDSSVIEAKAPGTVRYKRSQTEYDTAVAEAIITAKKVGTSRITVYNSPKAVNEVNVLVKVYPKGTFYGNAISLSGPNIIKLKAGEEREVYTPIVGGKMENLGVTVWSSENENVASVAGSGLFGMVKGVSHGVTRVKTSGDSIVHDWEGVVVVYNEGEEDSIPYIYSNDLIFDMPAGQMIRIPIYHPNISNEKFNMTVHNTNPESVYHVVSENVIMASGAKMGQAEIIVSTGITGCNELSFFINVVDDRIDLDNPYTLTGDNFIGLTEGGEAEYKVNLTGANAKELNKIMWSVDDPSVASVARYSGDTVILRGLKTGQTVLRINHMSSVNEKAVVAYVVETGKDPENIIMLGIERSNYVINKMESVFLRLITNATDEQKKDFRWQLSDDSILGMDENYDKAVILGLKEGNAKITVTDSKKRHLIDLDIYITVKNQSSLESTLGYPDSVIIVKNQNKLLKGNAINVSNNELRSLSYIFEDSSYAALIGQGLDVTLRGIAGGQTYLIVQCADINYYKKILVICVDNEEELERLFYFTAEKTLYRIKKGESLAVKLKFGSNGFPEEEKPFITWANTVPGNAVNISSTYSSNGAQAAIVGVREGIAVIEVKSRITGAPVKITVEVADNAKGSDFYWFMYNPIQQMSVNEVCMAPVSIYYGGKYYEDEEGKLTHGQEMGAGYSYITLENDNTSVVNAVMAGSMLRIQALQPGRAVITLSHELIKEDARILVVVYYGEVPSPQDDVIIFAPKTHYLVNINEFKDIKLESNAADMNFKNVVWNNSRNPGVVDLYNLESRMNAQAWGRKGGSAEITVEYEDKVHETIIVSVSDYAGNNSVYAATESIVILTMEDSNYATRIIISGGTEGAIYWTVENEAIVEVVGNGELALLYPRAFGTTDLKVQGIGFERKIVVKVVESEEKKMNTALLNIDKRYFNVKKGESISVSPYYKIKKPSSEAQMVSISKNNVISSSFENKVFTVYGKNIGIEHVIIKNAQCENEVELTFEVSEELTGSVNEVKSLTFMTIDKPVIRMEPEYSNRIVNIKLIGEYSGGMSDFVWKANNKNVSISSFGTMALISAGKALGSTIITVENKNYCANDLEIIVIVGPAEYYENISTPYIYAPKTTYTMTYGGTGIVIPIEIRNAGPVSWGALNIYSEKQFTNIRVSSGNLIVEARSTGVDIIHISYPALEELTVYVIITDVSNNSAVFLTTGQNYVIMGKNASQVVEVSLINYEEPDAAKIRWTSDDNGIVHIIGSGRTVQIIGMGLGTTKITAKHDKSLNDLDIVVKVVTPGSLSQICYLTTTDNVIETYLDGSGGQILINKVGGRYASVEGTWTVADPTVAAVIGSNSTAYYTPKKAGITKVTVSDAEAGSLSIIIIVRNVKPGSQYISTDRPIVQITPGTTNNVIQVHLSGGEETDEKDFRWVLYSQLPSNYEKAKAGGSVIGLYEMGGRASVSAVNAGVARVKVTHPKAVEALFIVIQVTNYTSLSFSQPSIDIIAGEMSFVTLKTPDWENYTDRIKFSTAGAGICTVMGSSRAALLSAQAAGRTEIEAYIEGTDMRAVITVNVIPEPAFDQPEILTSSTMYVVTPHEEPFLIDAKIMGVGITVPDQELLEWRIIGLEDSQPSPMIKIYPQMEEYEYENGKKYYRPFSRGKSIMVEVQSREYKTAEECTIEITCPSLTNRKKTIYVMVREDSNAFKMSKTQINMEANDIVELSCMLLGGKTKDYEEVIWLHERDSIDPLKKIVDILGAGQKVSVLGMADGVSKITAMYRNLSATCKVTVRSSKYFSITYENFQIYPGQRINMPDSPDHGNLPFIEYEVRPVTAHIEWLNTDEANNLNPVANVNYESARDINGTGKGRIYINGLREGRFTILGIASGHTSKVNVVVKNSYLFMLNRYYFSNTPYDFNIDDWENPKTDKNGSHSVQYTMSPDNGQIAIKEGKIADGELLTATEAKTAQRKLMEAGLEIIINPPHTSDGMRGTGTILIKNMKEFKSEAKVTFELIRPDGQKAKIEQILRIDSRYPRESGRIVPVFEPVNVNHSGTGLKDYSNPVSVGYKKGEMYNNGKYLGNPQIRWDSNSSSIVDSYNVDVGDGEEFYILLDKVKKDAYSEITLIKGVNTGESEIFEISDLGTIGSGSAKNGITAQLVTLENGNQAVRVSGGKDYIAYTNFGSDFSLKTGLKSDQPHNIGTTDYIPKDKVAGGSCGVYSKITWGTGGWNSFLGRYVGDYHEQHLGRRVELVGDEYVISTISWFVDNLLAGLANTGSDNVPSPSYSIPEGYWIPKKINNDGTPINFQYIGSGGAATSNPNIVYYETYKGYEEKGNVIHMGTRSTSYNSSYDYNRESSGNRGGSYGTGGTPTRYDWYYDVYSYQTNSLITKKYTITEKSRTVTSNVYPYNTSIEYYWSNDTNDVTDYYRIPYSLEGKRVYIKRNDGYYRTFDRDVLTTNVNIELYTIDNKFGWGPKIKEEPEATWELLPKINSFNNENVKIKPNYFNGKDYKFGLSPYSFIDEFWAYKTPGGSYSSGYTDVKHQDGRIFIDGREANNGIFFVNFLSGYILKFASDTEISRTTSGNRIKFYGHLPSGFNLDNDIFKKYVKLPSPQYSSSPQVEADLNEKYSYVQFYNTRYERLNIGKPDDYVSWYKEVKTINEFPFGVASEKYSGDSNDNQKYDAFLIDIFNEKYDPDDEKKYYDQYSYTQVDNRLTKEGWKDRYYPVHSKSDRVVHNEDAVIDIIYTTPYSTQNKLVITLKYKVRECPVDYEPMDTEKNEVKKKAVKWTKDQSQDRATWELPVTDNYILGNIYVPVGTSFNGKVRVDYDYYRK